jgi:hypothetical protein
MSEQAVSLEGTPIEADLDAEARRLLDAIEQAGLDARLIGGMAIKLLAGDSLDPVFERPIQDLDFIVSKRHRRDLERLLIGAGYAPEEQFNALNGSRRLLYDDLQHGRQIDVFVETFSMCHSLPLAASLTVRPQTLPAAELLMTKLQIVELNAKDRGDLYALLDSLELGPEGIDVERIVALTANDWGLQHTFELNLARLRAALTSQPLPPERQDEVARRIDAIAAAMEAAPKSRKWKLRAKVGERKRWYEEPEEIDREH